MQHALDHSLDAVTDPDSAQDDLYFCSSHGGLIASGVSQVITQSAQFGADPSSAFQKSIRQAFAKAQQSGIENPVVIGSIPFDVSQPSCLYIPERTQRLTGFNDVSASTTDAAHDQTHQVIAQNSQPCEATFKQAVEQAVNKFNTTALEKAVLSRTLNLELNNQVSPKAILQRLIGQNPQGFHFSIPQADGGVLLGASPELLVRRQGRQIISNPLAGSAKRQPTAELEKQVSEALQNSSKDRFEHKLVIDEIARLLSPICQELEVPSQPSLMTTPTMWHLSTRIEGQLADENTSALQLACLLHPTPAVCGYPFDLSKSAIEELEPFERDMYAGMVGWCDAQGNGEWAVTIRCGKIHGNRVRLFAGAGIVCASCPHSEWAETEAKLATMLKAFGINAMESQQ